MPAGRNPESDADWLKPSSAGVCPKAKSQIFSIALPTVLADNRTHARSLSPPNLRRRAAQINSS
jgi:hypothetical protein